MMNGTCGILAGWGRRGRRVWHIRRRGRKMWAHDSASRSCGRNSLEDVSAWRWRWDRITRKDLSVDHALFGHFVLAPAVLRRLWWPESVGLWVRAGFQLIFSGSGPMIDHGSQEKDLLAYLSVINFLFEI